VPVWVIVIGVTDRPTLRSQTLAAHSFHLDGKAAMLNRRQFMAASALASAALATGCRDRLRHRYVVLTDEEAETLTAICDQIIPADDFPSASQAGVLTFIDLQLRGPYKRHPRTYLLRLRRANLSCRNRFGRAVGGATPQQQLEIVREMDRQDRQFFELVRSHTMQGYYGSPRHGGNRDAVSWRMLGLDEPPLRGRAQYDFTAGSKP